MIEKNLEGDKMKRDFKEILVALKKYIKVKKSVMIVKNSAVAKELGCKNSGIVTMWEIRNSIPYEVILDYCLKEEINPMNIFYDKK